MIKNGDDLNFSESFLASIGQFNQFSQMVIEFHGRVNPKAMIEVYKKLNKNFIFTHIHGNNHDHCPWLDINFPKVID